MGRSASLSVLVHLVLLTVMFFGVRWQSHRPDVVEVELWDTPPPAAAPEPPAPPAPPKVEPAPRIEKPVIASGRNPSPRPSPSRRRSRRSPSPIRSSTSVCANRRRRAEGAGRGAARAGAARLLARAQVDARDKVLRPGRTRSAPKSAATSSCRRASPATRRRIYDVTLLPTGEILTVVKRKSSGNAGYDEAVERAILKSSPLPSPTSRGCSGGS